MTEDKSYCFMILYYEIIEGKVKKEYIPGYRLSHAKPKKLTIQQLKFIKNKTEYIPIDNFQNKIFFEESHYILVKDDDQKPFLYIDDIYFDTFNLQSKSLQYTSLMGIDAFRHDRLVIQYG